jgi:hypothetical protein
MSYWTSSLRTKSYWRYALFSQSAAARILAVAGGLYLFIEMLDFFNVYTRDKYSRFAFVLVLLASIAVALFTRRPVSKVSYKLPGRDVSIDVVIGDLFSVDGAAVISSSTTFDTNIADETISPDSLQGQLALRFFKGNTKEIDRQIEASLADQPSIPRASAKGKSKDYDIGTVAKVTAGDKLFYLVAMSKWNEHGNAYSSVAMVDDALEGFWRYLAERGELTAVVLPVMGRGRGRIQLPRKKIIERIAQSFVYASKERVFSKKLTIVINPLDAAANGINLFEVRDYLVGSLHI